MLRNPHEGYHSAFLDLVFLLFTIAACFRPRAADGVFRRIENLGARFAARKRLAVLGIAAAAIVVRLSLLGVDPVPAPQVHDEFSYLLAGDTFAHGRLANPPHAMWIFFETFHVNQHPTYASKYPPGQGAALALGELLGHPWIGVLLSVAAMCAAILWMLQGWLPARWALLGASLVFLRFGLFNYWVDGYWGGAVAATGGALVMGALPRIARRQRPRDALLLGAGAVILANSRPFEGLLLFLTVAVFLAAWLLRARSPSWRITLPRVVLPICAALALGAAFMGYYNWRVTGNALLFPFTLNTRTYLTTPLFIWERPQPPLHYSNPQFEDFYNDWARDDLNESFGKGPRRTAGELAREVWYFLSSYPGSGLFVPLLALPGIMRDPRMRFPLAQIVLCLAGSLTVVYFWPHYIAPLTGTVFLMVTQGMRHVRCWRWSGRPVGVGVTRLVVLFAAATIPFRAIEATRDPGTLVLFPSSVQDRARIVKQLESLPGQHLVIVRYFDEHNPHEEWVYNAADIDHAKIVWAREIPDQDIGPLLEYFRGRKVWLIEPDESPPRLQPYAPPTE